MRAIDAKAIPMSRLLSALGHAPVQARHGEWWYLSPFRPEKTASFKLSEDQKAWYDHGRGEGGNIIAFAQAYFDLAKNDVSGALNAIEQRLGTGPGVQTPLPLFEKPDPPALSPSPAPPEKAALAATATNSDIRFARMQPLQNTALLAYLEDQRKIDLGVARRYVQEVWFKMRGKDRWFFALAFPNDSGGYEWRNADDTRIYKRAWGHKDIRTIPLESDEIPPAVMVFEGFMDFLSALTHDAVSAPKMPVIVLNGTGMKDKAVTAIRAMGTKKVYLYLDRDDSGQQLTSDFQAELADLAVLDQSDLYAGHKDFNAFLQKHRQVERSR